MKYANLFPADTGKVGHGGTTQAHEMRKSTVRWLPRNDVNLRFLFDSIVLRALQVNHNAFGLELSDYPFLRFGSAQFTEYQGSKVKAKQGKYDMHEDNSWITKTPLAYDRKLSCVLLLSKPCDYQGGRLELERDNLTGDIFTQQGDLIFFPSHLRHRVTPVTKGIRRSLVIWFEGKPLS